MNNQDIIIRELKGFKEISTILPLNVQQNTDMDEVTFCNCLKQMLKEGYRCLGAFTHDGKMAGCAGFWVGTRFWCGAFIEPDNVVIDQNYRRLGIGEKLMAWIEEEGKRLGCQIVKLETYRNNEKARLFYGKLAYDELGLVIVRPLSISADEWHQKLANKAHGP